MTTLASESLTHVPVPQAEVGRSANHRPNVGELERTASVLLGSLLITSGIKRFSLAGLGVAFLGFRLVKRGATGQCSLYKALNVSTKGDDEGLIGSKTFTHPLHQHIRVEHSVTINKPVEEVFNFWRNFENLPRFMDHLESVKVIDEKHSHWVTKGPKGRTVEWDATIIEEIPNKKIAWKSAEGADVANSGQVLFEKAPGDRGTEVKVVLAYDPPAGIFGEIFAKLFGESPAQQVRDDLRHVKQILETGEKPTIEGQPQGGK